MDLENSIYDYLHEGWEIVPNENKQIQYKGGQQKGMYIGQGMSYVDFVSKACEQWILIRMDIRFIAPLSLIHLHFNSWMMMRTCI